MKSIIVGVTLLALSTFSFAALTAVDLDGDWSNGHEGVYDDVLNVTWLADANLAVSNTFGVSFISGVGQMEWNTAEAFVAAMNADNGGIGYLGVNTWRQPNVAPVNGISLFNIRTYDGSSDNGYQLSAPIDPVYNPNGKSPGFTGSELAYHYYNNFEGIGQCSGVGTGISSCTDSSEYGIDDAPDTQGNKALFSNIRNSVYWTGTELDSSSKFTFHTNTGNQEPGNRSNLEYVWAVADGKVGTVIPVPTAAWLFISAIFGLTVVRRRVSATNDYGLI